MQVFSTTDGAFVFKWGVSGVGEGQLNGPGGIDVDSQGNVWVADTRNHRVQKFSSTGTFIDTFGSTDTTEGALDVPVGIVVNDKLGKVYVTDEYSWRLVEFTTAGALVGEHAKDEDGSSILNNPDEITVDEENGFIYVIEAGDMEVSIFDANKPPGQSFIDEFYGTGAEKPHYGFSPHGIHFNPDNGELLVAAGGADGKKIWRYEALATPKLDVYDEKNEDAAKVKAIDFHVEHNAVLGTCNVKATGTLKTPQSDPFFEGDTFNVEGPKKAVRPRWIDLGFYSVPISAPAARGSARDKCEGQDDVPVAGGLQRRTGTARPGDSEVHPLSSP